MKNPKVQSLRSLRAEMKAVARGERPAPADAGQLSFSSIQAVVRLLTPDNRRLLALIRDRKPRSVAELVAMTGRAQPNLTRTLAKLEAVGFITMKAIGRRKTPSVVVKRIVVEIDPYSNRDRLRVARHERITLSSRDSARVLKLLERPPKPTAALRAARSASGR